MVLICDPLLSYIMLHSDILESKYIFMRERQHNSGEEHISSCNMSKEQEIEGQDANVEYSVE